MWPFICTRNFYCHSSGSNYDHSFQRNGRNDDRIFNNWFSARNSISSWKWTSQRPQWLLFRANVKIFCFFLSLSEHFFSDQQRDFISERFVGFRWMSLSMFFAVIALILLLVTRYQMKKHNQLQMQIVVPEPGNINHHYTNSSGEKLSGQKSNDVESTYRQRT